jgi:proteasome lid subunit RPN8/RPN11
MGHNKSSYMAAYANFMFASETPIAEAKVVDAMDAKVKDIYKNTDIILDVSVSIPVARYITNDIDSSARRISVFLNPSGEDSVFIAEGTNREIPLDCLEMQYYRFLTNTTVLHNHIQNSNNLRYARSCGDITSTIPQSHIALHAAIASQAVKACISIEQSSISIWQLNNKSFEVKRYDAVLSKIIKILLNDWTIFVDEYLINKISQARKDKIPKETGGILIGSFDTQRRIAYLVDTVLSPPDSIEWPTVYIRGCEGLREQVIEIDRISQGRLEYMGEWHSHPKNTSCSPSEDDYQAFRGLSEKMKQDGLPAIMLIAGDNKQYSLFVGEMLR